MRRRTSRWVAAGAVVAVWGGGGCSAPHPDAGPGVIHLIPRLEQSVRDDPGPPPPDPVDLLARKEAWSAVGGQITPGTRGLLVRGDPDAAVTLLWSPPGLALPVEQFETFAVDLGLTGADRFEVWCQPPGEDVTEAIRGRLTQVRHAENQATSREIVPFRIRAERLLDVDATGVDRVAIVIRWAGAGERELEVAHAAALATGDRPGVGGPRRARLRLHGDNLEAWQMGAGERHIVHLDLPKAARLLTSIAVVGDTENASCQVVVVARGEEHVILASDGSQGESWSPQEVDLSAFGGTEVDLVFQTRGARRTVFAWGAPVIVGERGARRDVVVWVIDTLREDVLGTYGFPGRTSPSISRLARSGTIFPECYSTTSWTRPAMGSLMTSRAALTHGAYLESRSIREDLPTFAEQMQKGGWYTVALISNPNAGRTAGLDRGYDRVADLQALGDALARKDPAGRPADTGSSSGTSERIHAWLQDWLPTVEDVPIFVYAHANDPHRPNAPRAPFSAIPGVAKSGYPNDRLRTWAREYGGDVVAADWFFGRSLRLFERREPVDRLIVALMADHGEEFREHGGMGHGTDLWPEQVRIPLVFWGPGLVPAGRIAPRRASLLDVQPTLLDLLSLPPVEGHEGRSLVEEWRSPLDVAGVEPPPHYLHLIDQDKRLGERVVQDSTILGEVALVDGGWKLILEEYGEGGDRGRYLYDLQDDPGETRNLAEAYPDLAREMTARVVGWWGASRRGAPAGPAAEVDAETEEILRALGYLN